MSPMTFSDRTETRSLGLLSSRISGTLNTALRQGKLPGGDEKRLLERGVGLLDGFVKGSRLVEGDVKSGIGPDVLRGFHQAVNTLTAIESIPTSEVVSNRFRMLRDELQTICRADSMEALQKAKLQELSSFFTTLAAMFYEDLARLSLEEAAPAAQNPSRDPIDDTPGLGIR